ncbi:MAG: DUF3267 domain-containing protein [Anaerolineae bacterium]|jgi:hypothetical protein|nr:DUF3267 domain-containing protein [Anaerolineae bacterium]
MPEKNLPANYAEYRHQNFTRDSMAYLSNNILIAVMLIFFYVIFSRYTQAARTDFQPIEFLALQGWEFLWILILMVGVMFAHEGVYWLSLKLFGASDAVFVIKGITPHAMAAKTYFKKWPFVLAKLMSIIVISVVYLLLAPVIPLGWIEMALYFFAGNVAYGTTDLIAIFEAIRGPRNVRVEDLGENVLFYADKEYVKKLRAKKGLPSK